MEISYQTYRMGDFTCLSILSNGCADSIGYIADHIPRAGSITLVAKVENEIAGYVLATASNAGVYVHNVQVVEKYRRNGIATKMLSMIEAHIANTECQFPIMLHAVESNKGAVSCYRKAGYRVSVRIPNHPAMYDHMLVMRKNA